MSRFVYWTILLGTEPTAFRASTREELLPTLKQVQRQHPEAVLRWFARGRVWESEEQEREARSQSQRKSRGHDWRPGGEHKDPRAVYKKPRAVRRKALLKRLREKEAGREGGARPPRGDRPQAGSRRREGGPPSSGPPRKGPADRGPRPPRKR
jgi:hypothetical protein